MRPTILLCVPLLALAVAPRPAHADPQTQANAHLARATAAHKEGRYADALLELETAFVLDPRPELLYALGQVMVKLERCPEAVTYYRRFLATNPKPDSAARAQQAIAVCNMTQAQPVPPPAEPAGPSPEEHLRKAKEAEARAAAERRRLELARLEAEREREREQRYDRHPARVWAYVAAGVGTASLIAGAGFGVAASGAQASFDDAGCGDRDRLLDAGTIAQCRDDADRGERHALFGNVFLGSGLALLATSVLVFAIDPGNVERPAPARASVAVSPSSIQLSVHW